MSYRQYLRLNHAEPSGALVLMDRDHEISEYDCDLCGAQMPEHHTDNAVMIRVYRRKSLSGDVSVSLDVCDGCLVRLPRPILAVLARYGLELPAETDEACTTAWAHGPAPG